MQGTEPAGSVLWTQELKPFSPLHFLPGQLLGAQSQGLWGSSPPRSSLEELVPLGQAVVTQHRGGCGPQAVVVLGERRVLRLWFVFAEHQYLGFM